MRRQRLIGGLAVLIRRHHGEEIIPATGVGLHFIHSFGGYRNDRIWQRMIRDMNLAGFTAGTQRAYPNGARQHAKHYMLSPDKLTEKQVKITSFIAA